MDRLFGPVYDRPPAAADDLTAVRGIDTREAVILNRLGVYFLSQVALWRHPECCAIAEELGVSASVLTQEHWVEQAERLCQPQPQPVVQRRHLPASFIRTLSLLSCAVVGGCLLVYWLSLQKSQPLPGTLSADITSLRVPAESRLIAAHVRAGDEVFSGDALLTLEKTEHLAMISVQEHRVRELERELEKSEAQASLDLEWRTRELDRELSDVRTRAHLIQEVNRTPAIPYKSASADASNETLARSGDKPGAIPATPVSRRRVANRKSAKTAPVPNRMIFVSGASGESSIELDRSAAISIPLPRPRTIAPEQPQMVLAAGSASAEGMLSVEARSVEQRLARLEELRVLLPDQVRRAAGVEGLRVQLDEATQRLTTMQTLNREVDVVCPAYGKVGQVRYRTGDKMSDGEVMLKILHTDRRFVMLYVPTRRLDEVEPGMTVSLNFPGNEKCQGRITNLPMLAETQLSGGPSLVSVRVEPVGRLWPEIPIGSQIDVALR